MRIQVLPCHIEAGTPCAEENCPVALAIMDALKGEPMVRVFAGSETVTVIYGNGTEKNFPLSWEITEIIDEYDATGVMYPFGFEL